MKQRKIKFRALYKPDNVVSINSFTIGELSSYEEHEWIFSDESTLPSNDVKEGDLDYLQFTGLKDKNGKEIYEGDIISCRRIKDNKQCPQINIDAVGYVVYVMGEYLIKWTRDRRGNQKDTRNILNTLGWWVSSYNGGLEKKIEDYELKLIGNIYENPDLLK